VREHRLDLVQRLLPKVFDTKRRPWIDMTGATDDSIEAQVARCPSRALKVTRKVSST
jgi:uncharacterized Fe-S cluster protein YjdI